METDGGSTGGTRAGGTTVARRRSPRGGGRRRAPGVGELRRLDRIEGSLQMMHEKLDRLADESAVARTDVAWLKWGLRILFAAVLGVGGVTAQAIL